MTEHGLDGFTPLEVGPNLLKVTLPSGLSVLARLDLLGPGGRRQVGELRISGGVVRSGDLRAVPIEAIEGWANRSVEPLPDVAEMDRGRLLEVWEAYAERFAHPAAELARRSGLKPPTIHTWVREARMRGQLPPTARCTSFPTRAED